MTRIAPTGFVSLAGLFLFLWPFAGLDLSMSTPAWALMFASVAGLMLFELGTRQLDTRTLALLAAIAAIDSALRLAVIVGIGGFNPIYFLVLCSGFVFGTSFGFMAGALSILVSALLSGGVGPWVPYQVFAMGWIGVAAGVAGRSRNLYVLAAVGLVMGYVFGALMDVPDWVTGFRGNPTIGWSPGLSPATAVVHFARFYALTSFAYDSFRAVGNLVMVLALGAPTIAALERFHARLTFDVVKT